MPDDATTLLDIVLACRRIVRFTGGVDHPSFDSNEEKRWATVSQLLIVGEAVKRLSESFRGRHPRIPWSQMAGMRNRLIHQYDKINWGLVWQTATQYMPKLLGELETLIPAEEKPDTDGSGAR
jgi:uncharacterized protein with HEPN domain